MTSQFWNLNISKNASSTLFNSELIEDRVISASHAFERGLLLKHRNRLDIGIPTEYLEYSSSSFPPFIEESSVPFLYVGR